MVLPALCPQAIAPVPVVKITLRRKCSRWEAGEQIMGKATDKILDSVMIAAIGRKVWVGRVFPYNCTQVRIKTFTRSFIAPIESVQLYQIL